MPKIWIIPVGLIVVAGGMYYLFTYRSAPNSPSITFVSPKGGEAWEVGSTHSVTWSTRDIPSTYKISVTIRRIPPPPLQEEGQEFDPIIFTNLPNTGSAEWTVAHMYPAGTYVLGLEAYESTPITTNISAESAPFQIKPAPLAQDLYPLYGKVDWDALETETVTISTTTYSGTSVRSVPVNGTMDPASIFSPFERFYDTRLKGLGWKIANDLAAGGHVGGQTGYRKADKTILVRFNILYHTVTNTAPSECPCDVTLSLFSTN